MTDKTLILYGIKTCQTCKKAFEAVQAGGFDAQWVDIRSQADLGAKLPAWADQIGWDALVNRASMTWRNLSDAEKASADGDAGTLALLKAKPTLIKRPVIEHAGQVTVGWTKPVREGLDLEA